MRSFPDTLSKAALSTRWAKISCVSSPDIASKSWGPIFPWSQAYQTEALKAEIPREGAPSPLASPQADASANLIRLFSESSSPAPVGSAP